MRSISLRAIVATAATVGLAGAGACHPRDAVTPFDEDRSEIIVRSGSVDFVTNKPWQYDDNNKKTKARPTQAQGASVAGFEVWFDNAAQLDGSAAGQPCPLLPMVGERVDIAYKSDTLTIDMEDDSGKTKKEPVVTAPAPMQTSGTGNSWTLTHDAGGHGAIAKVTITLGGASESCQPKNGSDIGPIHIKPLR